MRRIISILIILTTFSIIITGCSYKEKENAKPAQGNLQKKNLPVVKVYQAENEKLTDYLESTGEVASANQVTIQTTTEGVIAYCPWREGDKVEAGQLLIEIDRSVNHNEVRAMEAALGVAVSKLNDLKAGARPEEIVQVQQSIKELEESTKFAKSDMERTEFLVQNDAIPGESLEKARIAYTRASTQLAAMQERLRMLQTGPTSTEIAVQEALVREASAKVEVSRAKLAEARITAPFSGIITKVHVRPGDMAALRNPLIELMETSSLVVRFVLPEKQAKSVTVGSEVKSSFDVYPDREFITRINRIYPQIQNETRTIIVEAEPPKEVELIAGMFARVSVDLGSINGILVPVNAIVTTPQGEEVVFVAADGKASRRIVKTGKEINKKIHIESGIKTGEKVIISGNENLRDGAEISVQ
jgi:multidrug efflux pump subunit AcrA (membrane-fusion protein)